MQQTTWAPRTAGIALCGIAGAAMAFCAVTLVTDPPGRVLAGVAATGLILFATVSWHARPKLAITPDGLVARGWVRAQRFRPADITLVRITEFRRIGRRMRLLEIEAVGGRLLIFSRWDLGTDPLDVLDALTAAGYAGS
ncbi:PH domain-containing protein [Mycobacterium sp.]|uniref:PH domain-containing protein n=1 Tax=Mycobacterium sp. TaxID=1785 RepID=UPI0031CFB805